MRHGLHFVILSISLMSMIFTGVSSAPPAFAHVDINVSNDIHDDFAQSNPTSLKAGQSFRPVDGVDNVSAIDIFVEPNPLCGGDTWAVTLHRGGITGPPVIPTFAYGVDSSPIQHIDLPPSIEPIVSGGLYTIEIIGAGPDCL